MSPNTSKSPHVKTLATTQKSREAAGGKKDTSLLDRDFVSRVIIDSVSPNIDHGRHPAKAVINSKVQIQAVILCDGHEILKADLLYRRSDQGEWQRVAFRQTLEPNVYEAHFQPDTLGTYIFTVEAAIDRYAGWRHAFLKKLEVGEATNVDVLSGIQVIEDLIGPTAKTFPKELSKLKDFNSSSSGPQINELKSSLLNPVFENQLRSVWTDRSTVRYPLELEIYVDSERAGFSSWYEFFPRSRWDGLAPQGNLKDAAARLSYVADLGFDVVYFPPIHPIGEAFRKGKNNTLKPDADDVGSPWAIGGKEGGHKAIHPDLGNFKDFEALVKKAKDLELDIALDIAFQCSPDHPYVKEHPEWFLHRADGTIQYAENPPKKYQDIYPFDFECEAWRELWQELKSVIDFWIERGVRIFRVDNPHTKSFPFWEWAIGEIHATRPDIIFLAEAFTKPHVMAYLAKIGFNQSYTYFTWRNTKAEFSQYLKSLTQTELKYYFRPNFWPNTPDILPESLQSGQRTTYVQRLLMAAMMSSNYGIYGPAFELMDSAPLVEGKEDYLNSEKYQTRDWDISRPYSLAPIIKHVNRIRKTNPALHNNNSIKFHPVENDNLTAFTKQSDDGENIILVVINLDPHNTQVGMVDFQIHELGIDSSQPYTAHDLLTNARYQWQGWRQYIELDPHKIPAHIFKISQTKTSTQK